MIKFFKQIIILFVIFSLSFNIFSYAEEVETDCPCYVLMEKTTGDILLEKDAHRKMPMASVTKIMTMLITFEEIEKGNISLNDTVTASTEASKMGGSQIYLK